MSKETELLTEIRDGIRELVVLFRKNLKIWIATDTTGRAHEVQDNGEEHSIETG